MKYYVTYSITHPVNTSMTATGMVEARNRVNLEIGLARGIRKWEKKGYTIEIIKVASMEDALRMQDEIQAHLELS